MKREGVCKSEGREETILTAATQVGEERVEDMQSKSDLKRKPRNC